MGILVDLMSDYLFGDAQTPRTGPEAARWVSNLYGSGRAASRATGIPESTLRGWRKGVQPKGPAAARLLRLVRVAAPNLNYARDHGDLTIQATVQFSGDRRDRIIHPGRYIPRPLIRRILTEWANLRDQTAETMIHNAVMKYYFDAAATETLLYMQPTRVWFE